MNMQNVVVLDIGSLYVKLGLSGEDIPKYIFTNHVGCIEDKRLLYDGLTKPVDAEITQPFKNGLIMEKENFEFLLTACLAKYQANDLVMANNFTSKVDRQRACEILFEKASLSSIYLAKPAALSAFSSGKSSATILVNQQSNNFVRILVPIKLKPQMQLKDHALIHLHTNLGANIQMNPQLKNQNQHPQIFPPYSKLLILILYNYQPQLEANTEGSLSYYRYEYECLIRSIKHHQLMNDSNYPQNYLLPDGNSICYQPKQINRITQKLFGVSRNLKGIQNMVLENLVQANYDQQELLAQNVLITGGASAIHGVVQKAFQLIQENRKIKLIDFPNLLNRQHSVFIGASIIGSLSNMQLMYVTRAEYNENNHVINKKFP